MSEVDDFLTDALARGREAGHARAPGSPCASRTSALADLRKAGPGPVGVRRRSPATCHPAPLRPFAPAASFSAGPALVPPGQSSIVAGATR